MTIKAVLRDGRIHPTEPLPTSWANGQELVIEEPEIAENLAEIDAWAKELEASIAQIPAEEHDRFLKALTEIEQESKEAVRRQWGLK